MDVNLMRSGTRCCISALLCCLFFSPTHAAHIDFISDGGFLSAAASTITSVQTGNPGNILGAEREVTLDFAAGSGILSGGITTVPMGPGPIGPSLDTVLLLDNSVNSSGVFKLLYNGIGSAGLGGLDFDTDYNMIDVVFSAVQGTGTVSVRVSDTSAGTGALSREVYTAGSYSFPFSDAAYASVNFGAVDAVEVVLQTTEDASDFAISEIVRAVPEPSSGTLLLASLLAAACLIRPGCRPHR